MTWSGQKAKTTEEYLGLLAKGTTALSGAYYHTVRYQSIVDLFNHPEQVSVTPSHAVAGSRLPNKRIQVQFEDGSIDMYDFVIDGAGYADPHKKLLQGLPIRWDSAIEVRRSLYDVDMRTRASFNGRDPRAIARQLISAEGNPLRIWTAGPAAPGLVKPEETANKVNSRSDQAVRNPVAIRNSAYRVQVLAEEFAAQFASVEIASSGAIVPSSGHVAVESARLVQHDASGLGQNLTKPWTYVSGVKANDNTRYFWELQVHLKGDLAQQVQDLDRAVTIVNVADGGKELKGQIFKLNSTTNDDVNLLIRIPATPRHNLRADFYVRMKDSAGREHYSNEGHPSSFASVQVHGWSTYPPAYDQNTLVSVPQGK